MTMRHVVIVATWILLACQSKNETTNGDTQEATDPYVLRLTEQQQKLAEIAIDTVALVPIRQTLQLTGSIDVPPQNLVTISCPLGGYVRNIHLLPGEAVRKGQVIAVMEDPAYVQLQQDYLVAKARLQYLRKEAARQKDLAATEASSKKQFEEVSSQLAAEEIQEHALAEKLAILGINTQQLQTQTISRQVSVRSPIQGFVSRVNVNVGKYVGPTDVLVELVDPGDIHAALTVYEKDISFLKEGQQVTVSPLNDPQKNYKAEILLVSRNLDEKRSGQVHCHFNASHPELVPGMYIKASVDAGSRMLPGIAESAVVRYQGKQYVFVQEAPLQYRLVQAEISQPSHGLVALLNNHIAWQGKRIVTKNAFTLLSALFNSAEEEE